MTSVMTKLRKRTTCS